MHDISVLVVDDHAIVREGTRQILAVEPGFTVVGVAEDGDGALEMARSLQPDVVVLDISLPGVNGLDFIPLIKRVARKTEIVILSIHQKSAFVHQALKSGALGYVLKTAPISDLVTAIRSASRKEFYLSKKIEKEVIGVYTGKQESSDAVQGYDALSEREQAVFRLVVQGKSSKQIGKFLCLSPRTVEKYRASVLHKLDLKNSLERLKYAIKLGIIDPDEIIDPKEN